MRLSVFCGLYKGIPLPHTLHVSVRRLVGWLLSWGVLLTEFKSSISLSTWCVLFVISYCHRHCLSLSLSLSLSLYIYIYIYIYIHIYIIYLYIHIYIYIYLQRVLRLYRSTNIVTLLHNCNTSRNLPQLNGSRRDKHVFSINLLNTKHRYIFCRRCWRSRRGPCWSFLFLEVSIVLRTS